VFNTRLRLVVRVRLGLVVVGRCCRGPRPGGARITKDSPKHGRTVSVDVLSLTVLGGIRWCVMVPPNGSRRVLPQYQFPPSHRDVADPPSTDLSSRKIQSRPRPWIQRTRRQLILSSSRVSYQTAANVITIEQAIVALGRSGSAAYSNSEASQWQLVLRQFL
jgi:hypothetical protein